MYHRGEQWKDLIYDTADGSWQTEEEYIKKQGKMPLKQNQVRQIVKNLVGQYRSDISRSTVISRDRDKAQIGEMLTNALRYALEINKTKDLDTRAFEEFLLSGVAFQKTRFNYMPKFERDDVFVENRPVPQMFFNDNIKDVRLTDMDLIGEFYDLPIEKIVAIFAKTPEDEKKIRHIYSHTISRELSNTSFDPMLSSYNTDNLDFYNAVEPDYGRVFEIWQKVTEPRLRCHDWLKGKRYVVTVDKQNKIDEINAQRIQEAASQGISPEDVPIIEYTKRIEEFWYVKFLSPYGYRLFESETIYAHKEHPYTVLLYPLIDGEVWGFVEDIIDQQRFINRLIMLMDFMIGASAKGVLLVPEDSIPDDMDIDDIADEWSRFNGVIKIKLKPGAQVPKQINSSASMPGANELLALQLKFINDISGVSSAIQGQRAPSGTPAKLYAQETHNATINTKDYFDTFNGFLRERDWKVTKTIVQFYDSERKIALAGSNYSDEALTYTPDKAKNAEVDVIMTKSADSPVYRAIIEDSLQQFVASGLIDLEMYLKNSTLPFSDKLLDDINKKKEAMMDKGAIDPALMQEIGAQLKQQGGNTQAANPRTMDMLDRYMDGR
jgi:hypothetical protein